MSYQHAYHAGNPADVLKHASLAALLAHMRAKPKPLTYLETHAGRGLYDLSAPESLKTGEAALGITRFLAEGRIPEDHPYLDAVRRTRVRFGEHAYPGSPMIAELLLGAEDSLNLMELHPAEHAGLKRAMRGSNVHIHRRDGFEGALAIAPPQPRRGLVLIDPSFEVKTEYQDCADFIKALAKKWPEAVIVLWYPLLEANLHKPMLAALAELAQEGKLKGALGREVHFRHRPKGHRMLGSGLWIGNPPFGIEAALDEVVKWFA